MPPPPNTTRTNLEMDEGRLGRKRRPTERVTENGDPLARKRPRPIARNRTSTSNTTGTVNEETAANVARRAPVGDARTPTPLRDPRPDGGDPGPMSNAASNTASNTADSADEESNRGSPRPEEPKAIEINDSSNEEPEEDDITELSMCCAFTCLQAADLPYD